MYYVNYNLEPSMESEVCVQTVSSRVFNLVNTKDEGYGWILFFKVCGVRWFSW